MNKLILLTIGTTLISSCKKSPTQTDTHEKSEPKSLATPIKRTNQSLIPSYSPHYPAPADTPEVFTMSQDYPTENVIANYPWTTIDFKTKPNEYMAAVLAYCLEGNIEADFKGQNNKKRTWYHAPWLHDEGRIEGNEREYIRGLTRERGAPRFEIHDKQDVALENWAVGMYNAPGGYGLGQVWHTEDGIPDITKANFPEGTATFKLLFTDGTVDKVPFLENTFEWTANIYSKSPDRRDEKLDKRVNRTVRLLQIDIAVKDKRATSSGWVFGTFIYDATHPGETPWDRLVPVGLSWGDDETVLAQKNKDGAFINPDLKESYLNASLLKTDSTTSKQAYVKYHGIGGRLNGPVDNPLSSCISCHGQAGLDDRGNSMQLGSFRTSRSSFSDVDFLKFFSNVKPGAYERTFDGRKYNMTDYSLQVSKGIRNYKEVIRRKTFERNTERNKSRERPLSVDPKGTYVPLRDVRR